MSRLPQQTTGVCLVHLCHFLLYTLILNGSRHFTEFLLVLHLYVLPSVCAYNVAHALPQPSHIMGFEVRQCAFLQ